MLVSREKILHHILTVFPFNFANPEFINEIVDFSEMTFFEPEKFVYVENAPGNFLYIIYEGEIELLLEVNQKIRRINILQDGSIFGEEGIFQNAKRKTSARTKKNTLLIKMPIAIIRKLINEEPKLKKCFHLITQTQQILLNLFLDEFSYETIYLIERQHKSLLGLRQSLTLALAGIPVYLLALLLKKDLIAEPLANGGIILFLVIFLTRFIWNYFEWKNDLYILTSKRIVNITKNLFNLFHRFEIPIYAINHLEIKTNYFGRKFNFGNLGVRTFTGETVLRFIPFVSEVQGFLETLIAKEKINRSKEEKESFERMVAASLEFVEADNINSGTQEHQKFEVSNNTDSSRKIIFHTHWIILLRKLFIPALIMVSLLLLVIFFISNHLPIFGNIFGTFLVGIFTFGLLVNIVYNIIDWRNDQYQITEEQIIDVYRNPLGTEERRTASLTKIQSIRFEKNGLPGMIFNYGTVYIRVGDEEFTFDNVPDPASIQAKLFNALEASINKIENSKITEQQHKMAELMETFHQVKERNKRGMR